ncbi:MAG: hypothetical protein PSX36_00370 [bacterium]|nr:hypothetical protein [bacterium]
MYQKAFTEDTGFPVTKDTMSMYIQYYLARSTDAEHQMLAELLKLFEEVPLSRKKLRLVVQ